MAATAARPSAGGCGVEDQVGRAGYVDSWPRNSENQPHHAGGALIWGPDGELIASTQVERIKEEMIVATAEQVPIFSGSTPKVCSAWAFCRSPGGHDSLPLPSQWPL